MKTRIVVALMAASLFAGCAGSTKHGQCIGFWDKEKPEFEYVVSKRNALVSLLFIETGFVPVFWAFFYGKCPARVKQ